MKKIKPAPKGLPARIRLARYHAEGKPSQTKFAKRLGVDRSAVAQWELGIFAPSSDNMAKIAVESGVYHEWLTTGRGEMKYPEDEHIESSAVAHSIEKPSPRLPGGIPELDIRAGMGGGGVPSLELRRDGDRADAIKQDYWYLPRAFMREELRISPPSMIVMETQGDSMFPTLAPGDRVFVNTAHKQPSPDGIYAMRDQFGALIVKRLHALPGKGRFSVISDNTAHPAQEVRLIDLDVVGRVVAMMKRL